MASAARPRPGDQALILALLSGILLALSFPRYGHPLFAWIALTPLIVPLFEIHHSWPAFRRGRAFLLGLVAGLAYFGGTVYWTGTVVSQFGGLSWPVGVVVAVAARRVSRAVSGAVRAVPRMARREVRAAGRSCSRRPSG